MLNSIAMFGPLSVNQSVWCAPTSRTLVMVELQQSKRINPPNRVRRVSINVDVASQSDRVLANEPLAARIIVPMPVIDERGAADAAISFI